MKTTKVPVTMMRAATLLCLAVILCTCGRAQEESVPQTSEELQEALRTRRAELRELTMEVESLESRLAEIDPNFAPNATLVSYETVGTASFDNYAEVQATVRAAESAMATSEIPGRILRMNFEAGDNIRKGQLVAVLDVEGTETQRAELETAASLAKTVYERQEKLWEQNIGSELQYLQAKNNYERIQQQLKAIDIQANKRNVYAPLSGTVDQVFLRTGEAAAPGTPILSIISTSDLQVVADAPESLLTKVKVGEKVGVRVPALGVEFKAPVTRIGRTVDPANRTFEVEVDVPRQYINELKANLLAEVEVLNFQADDLIVVSQDYIQQEVNGQRYVFVAEEVDGDLVARKTYVETGQSFNNRAVIESGLDVGARLITNGARGLTDGQPIALSQSPLQPTEAKLSSNNG
ncbi:efflux RND transporter periplasmic adaptor subunit [Neolewinella litorea]|uniref:Efflux RND transporter periplasmic adaptor subunit n=1 Tax=Neolewinella litorea TaxID=2562452 RepID=A0A4S4NNF6_9BACT|nr:efflux RND transporter periplasmic adaptor subunit [Neolewinella litorea]THH39898.1 efflux RND transporter periplasmic adaptor subunit [Neolewinella litorea]